LLSHVESGPDCAVGRHTSNKEPEQSPNDEAGRLLGLITSSDEYSGRSTFRI
jgi:hypothetical protein